LSFGGALCPEDPTRTMTIQFDIQCNSDAAQQPTQFATANNTCMRTIAFSSPSGCPVTSINAIWTFLERYKYLWGAIFIAVGFFLCLFGRKMFKPTIFILGMGAFVFISMLVFYSAFFSSNTESYVGWIVLAVSVVVGIIVGLILAKLSRLGVAVLASWGGACLALLLWSAFLYKINNQVVFWVFLVLFALVFASLSCCMFDHILIISTSLVGAYGFVRGISMYAGGYPNEFTLVDLIKNGLID